MIAEQEMKDLLLIIDSQNFSAEETTHLPTRVELEYAPNKLVLRTIQPSQQPYSLEMALDASYTVIGCTENFGSQQKTFTKKEIQDYEDYGFFTNFQQQDPRYVISYAKNIQEIQPCIYRMKIAHPRLDAGERMLGISSYAEIELENGHLKKMQLKTKFKSGKEKPGREIIFH
ncbi:hypothetical protein HY643_01825 [Candidatus Woesearchaeota archaeon]|nr:hypothetical protein [Candidatus Woesearchaeota archaeon]